MDFTSENSENWNENSNELDEIQALFSMRTISDTLFISAFCIIIFMLSF